MHRLFRSPFLRAAALFLLYFATGKLGLSLSPVSGFAALVWPPTGIALVALLLGGTQLWPAVFLGALAVNWSSGAPLLSAVGIAVGNSLEAVIGAYLLGTASYFRPQLDRLQDVLTLSVFAAIVSTIFSASLGCLSLWLGGLIPPGNLSHTWISWWIGDMLGNLVLAPFILTIISWRPQWPGVRRAGEGLMLLVTAALCPFLTFHYLPIPAPSMLLLPLLIWSALRFGPTMTTTVIFLMSMGSILETLQGYGPFGSGDPTQRLLFLQIYMAALALTGMTLAAALAERSTRENANQNLLERLRVANQVLQQRVTERAAALRARDQFLAIASHELKTPLTSLKLQLQLTRRNEKEPDKLLHCLDQSIRHVNSLTELVENLLDVTRIESGRLELKRKSVDLSALLREIVQRQMPQLNIARCEVEVDAPPSVIGQWDPIRLEQLFGNLLSNVVKYAAGSQVRVELRQIDGVASVIVQDDGPGISSEMQPRIFQPFERAAPVNNVSGMGLGLYVAKSISEAHRGSIRVDSSPGKGTRLTVHLPLHADDDTQEGPHG